MAPTFIYLQSSRSFETHSFIKQTMIESIPTVAHDCSITEILKQPLCQRFTWKNFKHRFTDSSHPHQRLLFSNSVVKFHALLSLTTPRNTDDAGLWTTPSGAGNTTLNEKRRKLKIMP